jgi:ankyrin repeat protein
MLLDSRSYSAINILLEGIDVNLTLQTQILEHLPQIDEGIPVLEHLSWMLENDLFEIFKLFLEHNDIQFEPKQDEKEYNFLRLSVKKPKYLQLMLEKGANPNHISGESNPLFEAIREKNLTSVRFLLHFGAIVNYENDEGVNALAIAIVQNSIDIFQELMMRDGIDVTLGRQTIHYPLYCAFKRKDIESAKLLSSHFEQDKVYNFWLPKEKKWQKFSLLSFAEILNFSKFIEWWVNEGANINFVSIESPRTLLETMLHREDFAKNSKNIKLVKSLGGCVLEDGYQNKISNIAAALSSKPAFSKVVTALKAKVTCFKSKDNFFDAFLYPALSVEKCAALESCHIYNDQVEVRSYFSKKTYTRIFNINCPNLYGHMEEFASKY